MSRVRDHDVAPRSAVDRVDAASRDGVDQVVAPSGDDAVGRPPALDVVVAAPTRKPVSPGAFTVELQRVVAARPAEAIAALPAVEAVPATSAAEPVMVATSAEAVAAAEAEDAVVAPATVKEVLAPGSDETVVALGSGGARRAGGRTTATQSCASAYCQDHCGDDRTCREPP